MLQFTGSQGVEGDLATEHSFLGLLFGHQLGSLAQTPTLITLSWTGEWDRNLPVHCLAQEDVRHRRGSMC